MRPISGDAIRPVSGEPLEAPTGVMPPVTPREEQRYHAEAIDRSALRRAGPQQQTVAAGDGVYRTKRPAMALLFAILTVIFEFGAVRVLLDGMFGGPFLAGQTIAGMFLIAGLPVFVLGLYGASGGGVRRRWVAGRNRPSCTSSPDSGCSSPPASPRQQVPEPRPRPRGVTGLWACGRGPGRAGPSRPNRLRAGANGRAHPDARRSREVRRGPAATWVDQGKWAAGGHLTPGRTLASGDRRQAVDLARLFFPPA